MPTTISPEAIRLSKVAPWNRDLRNSYRDRFTIVGGRRFRVFAESLDGLWFIEEVEEDGEPIIFRGADGKPRTIRSERGAFASFDFGFMGSAMRLSDARRVIAKECSRERDEHAQDHAVEDLSIEHGRVYVLPVLPDGSLRATVPSRAFFRISPEGDVSKLGYADFAVDWEQA
jgi:hypothetical protein